MRRRGGCIGGHTDSRNPGKEGYGEGIDITGMEGWEDELSIGERKRLELAAAGEAAGNGDGVGSTGKRPVRKWLGIW